MAKRRAARRGRAQQSRARHVILAGLVTALAFGFSWGQVSAGAVTGSTVSGSATDTNACTTTANPPLSPPGSLTATVTVSSDAASEPHARYPIVLSNTKLTFTIAGDLLQAGVAAGLIRDGLTIPTAVTLQLAGSNTLEATHTYTANAVTTVYVVGGVAQPLVTSVNLFNTTWHPRDAATPVVITEASLKVVQTIDLSTVGIVFTETFACTPSTTPTIIGIDGRTPAIVPGGASIAEGNSGTTAVHVPVTLSNPSAHTVTVQWTTLFVPGAPGHQADPASDYVAASGTLTFAPGETTHDVTIHVRGDTLVEPDEYLAISFRNPTNATIGGYYGLGGAGIVNDD